MRIVDAVLAIPFLFFVIVLAIMIFRHLVPNVLIVCAVNVAGDGPHDLVERWLERR